MMAWAYLSGVLSKPSRSGSSPIHSRMVRTAETIIFSRAERSVVVSLRRETVDFARERMRMADDVVLIRDVPGHPRPLGSGSGLSREGMVSGVDIPEAERKP